MEDEHKQSKKWQYGYVYIIDYGDNKTFKIGYTTKDPNKRLNEICGTTVLTPMRLVLYSEVYSNAYYIEQLLHMKYDRHHINGEWFSLDFVTIAEIIEILFNLGDGIEYTDHWYYKIVPEDYREYIRNYAILCPQYIQFEKDKMIAPYYKIEEMLT